MNRPSEECQPTAVWKVGGSLLARPGWEERLARWLAERRDARHLLVVGGGPAADVVREWDHLHALGDAAAHDLAIRALGLTAALVVLRFPGAEHCSNRAEAGASWARGATPVLDVAAFLAAEETEADRLPRTWAVTTDSIAAWVAARWPAERLVLLKSTAEPPGRNWNAAAEAGLVDRHFPRIAERLPRVELLDFSTADQHNTDQPQP